MSINSINQLRDYASLFSRSMVLDWLKSDFSSINYKISRYDKSRFDDGSKTYLDYLNYAYRIIEKNYPNEYVYKNSFINEWLIKQLGQQNSKIYSEFRLGSTIADLVMFNGVSKVFEIKTEFDTVKRLDKQLESYKNVFNEVYLIVPYDKIDDYLGIDNSIGIISYLRGRQSNFVLEREAFRNFRINTQSLMNVLYSSEYKDIIQTYYKSLPIMNSFNQFKICSDLMQLIPIEDLNNLFVNKLKVRGEENIFSTKSHLAFNQLSLALKLNFEKQKLMFKNLNTTIKI